MVKSLNWLWSAIAAAALLVAVLASVKHLQWGWVSWAALGGALVVVGGASHLYGVQYRALFLSTPPSAWRRIVPATLPNLYLLAHLALAVPFTWNNSENPPLYLLLVLVLLWPVSTLSLLAWARRRPGLHLLALAVPGLISTGLCLAASFTALNTAKASQGWDGLGSALLSIAGLFLGITGLCFATMSLTGVVRASSASAFAGTAPAPLAENRTPSHRPTWKRCVLLMAVLYLVPIAALTYRSADVRHAKSLITESGICAAPSRWTTRVFKTYSSSRGGFDVECVLLIPPAAPQSWERFRFKLDGSIVMTQDFEGGERRELVLPPNAAVYELRDGRPIRPDFPVTPEQAIAFIGSPRSEHSLAGLKEYVQGR